MSYHRQWDEDSFMFLDNPVHDWSSHDADAWRTLSLTWKFKNPKAPDSPLIDTSTNFNALHDGATFGDLKKLHFNKMQEQRDQL